MTVAEIFSRATKLVDDTVTSGTPALDNIYFTQNEAYCALNEAQGIFALMTLCLESNGTLPLSAARCFYGIRGYLPGFMLPLRLSVAGVKLQPAKMTDLDARWFQWAATPGTPAKYLQCGMNLLAIIPQPTGSTTLNVIFAKEPSVLTTTAQTPEIPDEYHLSLVKYTAYYLLQKRGGQYLKLAVTLYKEFLADASQCASYVRRRNRARQYDNEPAEIRMPVKKEGALTNA